MEETRGVGIILFIGAPGSGKGTQSALLSSRQSIPCISTGDILREEAKRNTPAGFRLRQTLATGVLVDDATVCGTVTSRLRSADASGDLNRGLILDGFPRTIAQARALDELLEELGLSGPVVVHLDVSNDILVRRLARRRQCARCGAVYNLASASRSSRCQVDNGALVERDDDSEGVVARRLAVYEAETLPVIEYYKNRSERLCTYRRLDGTLCAEEIAKEVCDIVVPVDTPLAA